MAQRDRNRKESITAPAGTRDGSPAQGEVLGLGRENLSVGVTLGTHRGAPVFQFDEDRFRHTVILGGTGSGKSNLVHQMEREDIRSGAGVFILAAHEEDALYPLACVPDERLEDVVLIDASDPDHLPRLNPLDVDPADRAAISKMRSDVLELLTGDDPDEWAGPRFESYLGAALGLLASDPHPYEHSLADIDRLFTDGAYAAELLGHCTDRRVRDFWTDVYPDAGRSSDAGEVAIWFLSKVARFLDDRVLRAVFGRGRRTVDIREAVARGRIVICHVPEDRIGTTAARGLCKWLVMQLRDAIMGRGSVGGGGLNYHLYGGGEAARRAAPEPFFVYVDEFSRFATPDFELLLAEARKQRVGLVLSTQTLSQTRVYNRREQQTGRLEEAILGNVGTTIAYPLGIRDARLLACQFDADVDRYTGIRRYRPLARLCMDNQPRGPIALEVDLQPAPDNPTAPARVAERMVGSGVWVEIDDGGDVGDAGDDPAAGDPTGDEDPGFALSMTLSLPDSAEPVSMEDLFRSFEEESTGEGPSDPAAQESDLDADLDALDRLLAKALGIDPSTAEKLMRAADDELKAEAAASRPAADEAPDPVVGREHPDHGLGHAYCYEDAAGVPCLTPNLEAALHAAAGDVVTVWAFYREGEIDHPATAAEYDEELEIRVGRQISEGIPEEKLREFDAITNATEASLWLEANRPDYRAIVRRTKREMGRAVLFDELDGDTGPGIA